MRHEFAECHELGILKGMHEYCFIEAESASCLEGREGCQSLPFAFYRFIDSRIVRARRGVQAKDGR